MQFLVLLPIILFMGFDWFALQQKKIKLGYITKPMVIVSIIFWTFLQIGNKSIIGSDGGNILWVIIGLIFSLAGDVVLMLPNRRFKLGLVLFLFAHISYNLALTPIFFKTMVAPSIFLAVFIVPIISFFVYLLQRVMNARKMLDLYPYAAVYLLVISSVLYRAISTFFVWKSNPIFSYLVALGAFSMFLADALLGYRQWVEEKKYARLMSRIFYQGGQALFAIGVVSHYLSL